MKPLIDPSQFICRHPDNEEEAQRYIDLFSEAVDKDPEEKHKKKIFELVGGEINFKAMKEIIKESEKEIKKHFPKIKPKKRDRA